MHEMGIAGSVLDSVRAETAKYPGARATKVGLRIGEWSGVDVESLRFCCEALIMGSDLDGLAVELDFRLARDELAIGYIEMDDGLAGDGDGTDSG